MVPGWVSEYVGLPFVDHGRDRSGVDCWGLVMLVYQERLGIALPEFRDRYPYAMHRGVADIVEEEMRRWTVVGTPEPFDVVVLRVAARPRHVGLWAAPGEMLCVDKGTESCIERLDSVRWSGRIEGYFRRV